ncbi:HK97 family phage prohead protease [Agromyces sp. Marseille-Q5079]|uniref:HK97 family phage prohead protease n=1 Tax=Agromyces sp. Marseille-Q5079 TaxID=3439059 RepID=UPI003D9CB94D
MPTEQPWTNLRVNAAAPGALDALESVDLAIGAMDGRTYVFGIVAPYDIAASDGRRPIIGRGLNWAPRGFWLRSAHLPDGNVLGATRHIRDTPSGVFAVFEIFPDGLGEAGALIAEGAGFSVGLIDVADTDPSVIVTDGITGSIIEVSLVTDPAHPEALVYGIVTPTDILMRNASGVFKRSPGPRHLDDALDNQATSTLDPEASLADGIAPATFDLSPLPDIAPATDRPVETAEFRTSLTLVRPERTGRGGGSSEASTSVTSHSATAVAVPAAPRPAPRRIATGALIAAPSVDPTQDHYLEGICVPYGRRTDRAPGGTPEVILSGAFAAAVAAPSSVRLQDNNHSKNTRPVGVAVELHETPEGLWGRFRLYRTPEGRAAFENVVAGTYGGLSVGFIAVSETNIRGVRNIQSARLDHVSLVDEPAYPDAQILAIRGSLTT